MLVHSKNMQTSRVVTVKQLKEPWKGLRQMADISGRKINIKTSRKAELFYRKIITSPQFMDNVVSMHKLLLTSRVESAFYVYRDNDENVLDNDYILKGKRRSVKAYILSSGDVRMGGIYPIFQMHSHPFKNNKFSYVDLLAGTFICTGEKAFTIGMICFDSKGSPFNFSLWLAQLKLKHYSEYYKHRYSYLMHTSCEDIRRERYEMLQLRFSETLNKEHAPKQSHSFKYEGTEIYIKGLKKMNRLRMPMLTEQQINDWLRNNSSKGNKNLLDEISEVLNSKEKKCPS